MQTLREAFRHVSEHIDEIDLALARDLCRAGDVTLAARTDPRAFLDFHPPGVDAALRGRVLLTPALVQVSVASQPVEKAVLPHRVARGLLDELRHFSDQDGRFRHLDGLGKDDFRAVGFGPGFQRGLSERPRKK